MIRKKYIDHCAIQSLFLTRRKLYKLEVGNEHDVNIICRKVLFLIR